MKRATKQKSTKAKVKTGQDEKQRKQRKKAKKEYYTKKR